MHKIQTNDSVTVIFESGFYQVFLNDFPYYQAVLEAVEREDEKTLKTLANVYKQLIDEDSEVVVTNEGVKVNGIVLDSESKISKFIIKLRDGGVTEDNINKIKPYIKNMFENPYIDAVEELYDFCEAHDFVITDDGCFLAYKNIRGDFTSIHDGVTRHDVGTEVIENYFDTDRTQTCSKGLHFCSKGYLKHFGYPGCITVIVKVNPRDVVAIPTDYNNMKGRCRKYFVEGILLEDNLKQYYRKNCG